MTISVLGAGQTLSTFGLFMCPPTHMHGSAHTMMSYYCIVQLYRALMKCLCHLKYTDCTLVMHPLHYGTYCSLHQMLTEQAAGCVLTSSPRSVDVKSYFQISCECIAFIADLLLCFGFPQPLSTHSTTLGTCSIW